MKWRGKWGEEARLSIFNCTSIDAGPGLYLWERDRLKTGECSAFIWIFLSPDPFPLRMVEQVALAIRRGVGLGERDATLPISCPEKRSGTCSCRPFLRLQSVASLRGLRFSQGVYDEGSSLLRCYSYLVLEWLCCFHPQAKQFREQGRFEAPAIMRPRGDPPSGSSENMGSIAYFMSKTVGRDSVVGIATL